MEKLKIEGSSQEKFKEETREKILRKRSDKLLEMMDGELSRYFDSFYTRIESPLGWSTMSNTPLAGRQLVFALAMSKHPVTEKLLRNKEEEFNPELLRQSEALKGIKILDLGCGSEPTFVRSARRFGADVYTADILSANEFELYKPSKKYLERIKETGNEERYKKEQQLAEEYEETRRLEKEKHIQIDLNDFEAIEIIKKKVVGQLDLITEAHLFSGSSNWSGPEINSPSPNFIEKIKILLKKDGVFYKA